MSCQHYKELLQEEHRHYINSLPHNNCVLCLVNEKGPMTQDEIGQYMGLSKMRISQILQVAQKKLSKRIKFTGTKDFT
jgi:DNA-directed RNA polymerase specialized sigma subunit